MSDDPSPVWPEEQLSRYIIESNKMKPSEMRARHTAFLPPSNRRLSVYRTSDASEAIIWEIGREFVAAPRKKTLYARADLMAAEVLATKLHIAPDTKVHPRHANIEGWPDDEAQKEQIALELAHVARLIFVPIS